MYTGPPVFFLKAFLYDHGFTLHYIYTIYMYIPCKNIESLQFR